MGMKCGSLSSFIVYIPNDTRIHYNSWNIFEYEMSTPFEETDIIHLSNKKQLQVLPKNVAEMSIDITIEMAYKHKY